METGCTITQLFLPSFSSLKVDLFNFFPVQLLHADIFKLNTVQCKFFLGEYLWVCLRICVRMAPLRSLHLFSDCVWGPNWSSFCQMSEALQRQPLGVLFHLFSYCSGADMQIRCNERSLCGGGSSGGWGKGGWTQEFKLEKGKVEGKRWTADSSAS